MEKPQQYLPLDHDESDLASDAQEDELLLRFGLSKSRRSHKIWKIAFLVVFFTAIYTVIVGSATWMLAKRHESHSRRHGTRFLKSPADAYITYHAHVMEQWEDEFAPQYFGEPSEELDRNWHELFEHQNLGLSRELMVELGRENEGIMLPDGTYYGSMMIFHHLHCLKNIQHALHPEYYQLEGLEGHELKMHWEHTDHCLHMLMDAVMCQGDTTLITMYWQDQKFRPAANFTSPHECVNWDRLMDWIVPNSRDVSGEGILVHPKLGPLLDHGQPTSMFLDAVKSGGFGKISNFG